MLIFMLILYLSTEMNYKNNTSISKNVYLFYAAWKKYLDMVNICKCIDRIAIGYVENLQHTSFGDFSLSRNFSPQRIHRSF